MEWRLIVRSYDSPPQLSMPDETPTTEWQKPLMTSGEMCGLLVRLIMYMGLVVAWAGYCLMDHQWPGALKLWMCSALGAVAVTWSLIRFLRQLRGFQPLYAAHMWGERHKFIFTVLRVVWALAPPRPERPLGTLHVIVIVIEVVLGGCFLAWLI